MNKQGIVFTRPRDTISFFVGLLVAAVGLLPLLERFGVIGFSVPFLDQVSVQVFVWLVAVFGLYVLIDGIIEPPMHSLHKILIVAGLVMFLIGLLPILKNFGVIGFGLPFIQGNLLLYQILLAIEGITLVIGGLTMH
jgi:hypothetical protein